MEPIRRLHASCGRQCFRDRHSLSARPALLSYHLDALNSGVEGRQPMGHSPCVLSFVSSNDACRLLLAVLCLQGKLYVLRPAEDVVSVIDPGTWQLTRS